MDYFGTFSSNTIAGSGNQYFFTMKKNEIRTSRVFYKITHGGTFQYSLLFSNMIDSTYADGSISQKNLVCESWTIHAARVGRCQATIFGENAFRFYENDIYEWFAVTFDGENTKDVAPGELFWTDPIELSFESGEYICVELTFSGTVIPYHEESLLPVFVLRDGNWEYDKKTPFVGKIGCDRKVSHTIAFWGDSITQGIGTPINSYTHWNALVAEYLGEQFACWNLGIGYARANDAASLGAWWEKVKHNETVIICLGANDILQNQSKEQIISDLTSIVSALRQNRNRIVLQTVPPFEYTDDQIAVWLQINEFIRNELSKKAELMFDVVPYLSDNQSDYYPKYGGHPNEIGCKIWAKALYEQLKKLF